MYKHYINGKLVDGAGAQTQTTNPADGSVVGQFRCADASQATQALHAARDAFPSWSNRPIQERVNWLNRFAAAVREREEELVDLLSAESGKPYPDAKYDFDWAMQSLEYYAEEGKRIHGTTVNNVNAPRGGSYHLVERRPIGVVVGHLAWNYPLGNAGLKIGPAMVSGCCCVLKPSSSTPLATLMLGRIMHDIGLPSGAVNILSGPSAQVASTLNSSTIPRMITLIGASETGLQVMREGATSIKSYSLELGGCAPVIVMPDANLDFAADCTVGSQTENAGQSCVGYNRIFVHHSVYQDYLQRVEEKLKKVRLAAGRQHAGHRVMGPMITAAARDRVLALVQDAADKGAKLMWGGTVPADRPATGHWVTPALLADVTPDMRVYQEELFSPIISVMPFEHLDDALAMAVDTEYGLTSFLFTHDARVLTRCFEAFQSGEVRVNGAGNNAQTPHSGVKNSGVGCDGSRWSLDEYFHLKVLDYQNMPD